MKKMAFSICAVVVGIYILAACASGAAPGQETSGPAATKATSIEKPSWQKDWEETVAAGKKEGQVVIYSPLGREAGLALSKGFKERTGIDVEFVSSRATETVEKLRSQRNAGLYLVDIHVGGSTTPINNLKPMGYIDPFKDLLILPEVLDPKAWWNGRLYFSDKEQAFIALPVLTTAQYTVVNTTLVKPGEIKSYRNLLDPKWKAQ